jgi:hypothetical protein
MGQFSRSRALQSAVIVTCLAASCAASAQKPPVPPQPLQGIETYLIRQTQSDCNNSNVNANNPSLIGGVAFVARQNNGNTYVKVEITGTPNTTYNFFHKCVGQLGTITTQDEGIGFGVFNFQTNSGTIVAFDMYPNGSPPGNTFQSVPITVE